MLRAPKGNFVLIRHFNFSRRFLPLTYLPTGGGVKVPDGSVQLRKSAGAGPHREIDFSAELPSSANSKIRIHSIHSFIC